MIITFNTTMMAQIAIITLKEVVAVTPEISIKMISRVIEVNKVREVILIKAAIVGHQITEILALINSATNNDNFYFSPITLLFYS